MIVGNVALPVASGTGVGNAWASIAATSSNAYQLLGFSGGCSNIACEVSVLFGSTTKLKIMTNASSGPISEWYGDLGPVTATNEALIVRTKAHANTARPVTANLLYRVVM